MKLIDSEKLKKYVENKREVVCDGLDWEDMDDSQRYAVEYLDDILAHIESLQEEQPEVDLEKELHTYICSDEYMNTRGNGSLLIARHFYELGLNARKV